MCAPGYFCASPGATKSVAKPGERGLALEFPGKAAQGEAVGAARFSSGR